MAKELPYFRFTVQEWQNGNISMERYELQGLFISICGFYWIQDCNVTLTVLQKKFSNAINLIEELLKLSIIKHEKKHDKINIDFLLTQYDFLSEKRKRLQNAGSKGGKAKARLKQKDSYKDKDKDKDNIDVRKLKFASTLQPFLLDYGKDLLNNFYSYWTEPNKSKSKFRQELEKTWDVKRRLETWAENDKTFNKKVVTNSNHDTDGLL